MNFCKDLSSEFRISTPHFSTSAIDDDDMTMTMVPVLMVRCDSAMRKCDAMRCECVMRCDSAMRCGAIDDAMTSVMRCESVMRCDDECDAMRCDSAMR